jgi:hypothetical protein
MNRDKLDQALLDVVAAQREANANAHAQANAELIVARARIAELEAELAKRTKRSSKKPAAEAKA